MEFPTALAVGTFHTPDLRSPASGPPASLPHQVGPPELRSPAERVPPGGGGVGPERTSKAARLYAARDVLGGHPRPRPGRGRVRVEATLGRVAPRNSWGNFGAPWRLRRRVLGVALAGEEREGKEQGEFLS